MIDLDEVRRKLNFLTEKIKVIEESLKIENLRKELKELEEQSTQPNFWDDADNSSKVFSKIKNLQRKINSFDLYSTEINNYIEMNELLIMEYDEELATELTKNIKKLEIDIEELEIQTLLSGEFDNNNAIITLHPGAGGTESQDWVEMLYRMYGRWANANGFTMKEIDYLAGDEAGIKSVTALVSGENAYGYLKGEMGVHRLVRISPFDSGGRRHTSFASLEVIPEIKEDNMDIQINPADLRVDTYRASGAGGQHINKTDSAVRITHIPTNIVVACQSERSQQMNRETAMTMLKSKLLILKETAKKDTIEELKGEQKDIAWGSQIRSYVFCPYTLVKDHRTNYEVGNVDAVMNGEINEFIQEYLKMIAKENN